LNERQRRAATSVQTGEPWFSPTGVAAVAQCGDRIPRITQYPVGSFLPGSTPY
jgi:hypothetical protein